MGPIGIVNSILRAKYFPTSEHILTGFVRLTLQSPYSFEGVPHFRT
jgi:hypothetical protein